MSYFPIVAVLGIEDPLGTPRVVQVLAPLAGRLPSPPTFAGSGTRPVNIRTNTIVAAERPHDDGRGSQLVFATVRAPMTRRMLAIVIVADDIRTVREDVRAG